MINGVTSSITTKKTVKECITNKLEMGVWILKYLIIVKEPRKERNKNIKQMDRKK